MALSQGAAARECPRPVDETSGEPRDSDPLGTLRFMSSTPAGGTIIIHARNKDGSLDGELPFAICN